MTTILTSQIEMVFGKKSNHPAEFRLQTIMSAVLIAINPTTRGSNDESNLNYLLQSLSLDPKPIFETFVLKCACSKANSNSFGKLCGNWLPQ